jgi:hypothetical protein
VNRVAHLGIATLVVLGATVFGVFQLARSRSNEAGARETADAEAEAATRDSPPTQAVLPRAAREESPSEPRALRVRVTSTSGKNLFAAQVELVWIQREDLDWECAWQRDDWGALDRSRISGVTTDSGEAALSLSSPSEFGAVIAASLEGHECAHRVLTGAPAGWPAVVEIALSPLEAPVTVLVVDFEGKGVPGAIVEQFGTAPSDAEKAPDGLGSDRAQRLLQRASVTNAEGLVSLQPFPGEQVLIARSGRLQSTPWRGKPHGCLTLELVPTFELSGEVAMPTWEHLDYVGERRITVAAQSRNLWRELASIREVEPGSYGPLVVPLLDVERYRVRLEGSPLIPVQWFFDPPSAGARLRQDLSAELGLELSFRVRDEAGEVIPTAMVHVQWQDALDPALWNFVERTKSQGEQIDTWSVPASGSVRFSAQAPGYVPFHSEPVASNYYHENRKEIVLKKAGTLRGKCLYRGNPVRDFEVIVLPGEAFAQPTSTSFFDREDGSFELDTIPLGNFWVTATSGLPAVCEPVSLSCRPGEAAEGSWRVAVAIPWTKRACKGS